MHTEIYLDVNATSATMAAAIAAAEDAMRALYGNPSSSHAAGLKAKAMLDAVRARARRLLGVGAGRLVFTSGATEGIQTAVLSALCAVRARQQNGEAVGQLLLYGATEHKAVPQALAHWNRLLGTGLELQALAVDCDGRHRLELLRQFAPRAALVCTMAANNETGVVSDLAAIEAVLAACAPASLWLVDSVQALGKLRLDLAATRIDYAPFSGHKLYAPKGVGMLYVRAGAPYTALMAGGGQEDGQRAGTENMAGIAALGAVLAALDDDALFPAHAQSALLRERLAQALRQAFPGVVFNMPFAHSLPTTLNFSVPGITSGDLLDLFDAAGVRVSAGSACSASAPAPSYVLDAMGLPPWRCGAAVRMSFGPLADDDFIAAACARIAHCGAALHADRLLPSATVDADAAHWLPAAVPPLDGMAAAVLQRLDGRAPAHDAALEILPAALEAFLLSHPDARLIDVREAFEHRAGGAPAWHGHAAENVPLSRLSHRIAEWLCGAPCPLVFLCRSGKRSVKAAQWLHRLGHRNAWHIAGGLALR